MMLPLTDSAVCATLQLSAPTTTVGARSVQLLALGCWLQSASCAVVARPCPQISCSGEGLGSGIGGGDTSGLGDGEGSGLVAGEG